MKLKKRELRVFCLLLFITIAAKQTVLARLFGMYLSDENARYLSVLRAALNIGIGYWGLLRHEVWWVKQGWCLFYLILLSAVLFNAMVYHFTGRSIFAINFDILASPFFYLLACLLPRIMRKYI